MGTTGPYIVPYCIVAAKRKACSTTAAGPAPLQHKRLKVHLLTLLQRLHNLIPLPLAHPAPSAVPARLLLVLAEATGPEPIALTRVAKEVKAEHKDSQPCCDGDESQA